MAVTITPLGLAGAEKIIAVDILPNKLEFARQFGASGDYRIGSW